ncbi:MAG: DUF2062 domain-containing protein [Deltaproteobacteria bacterium]|nr:DUF2062 domain-containing protein [Deltaproteobacteria bacterium]
MSFRQTLHYYWLKFKGLQDSPQKLAWGMALGVFIGMTPTVPFHTVTILFLAPLLRVSPVTALMGMWVMNPLTVAPIYLAAYKVGKLVVFRQTPLTIPATLDLHALLGLLWRGGLALQVGGLIIAWPPAFLAYFLTLWAAKRLQRAKSAEPGRTDRVSPLSPKHPASPGSET